MSFQPIVENLSANYITIDPMTGMPSGTVPFACQLYIPTKSLLDVTPGAPSDWVPPIFIRTTDATLAVRVNDQVECPGGSGHFYTIRWFETFHRGFPNQYRGFLVEQRDYPNFPTDG